MAIFFATAHAGVPTAKNLLGLNPVFPNQMEKKAFEAAMGKSLKFRGNPLFAKAERRGVLPRVASRLPREPLVVLPHHVQGRYGGCLDGLSCSMEARASEILSWRHTNLVRFSDDGRTLVPNVAVSWQWNREFTEILFTLRKGHRWSDGEPFTSEDVRFWFQDILLNGELTETLPSPWRELDTRLEVVDAQRFRFVFNKPYLTLLYYLGGAGSFYPPYAPAHFFKSLHPRYNDRAEVEARALGFTGWSQRFLKYWEVYGTVLPDGTAVPTLASHVAVSAGSGRSRLFRANPYYFKVDSAGNQLPYIDFHRERFMARGRWAEEILAGRVDQKSQHLPLSLYPQLAAGQGDYHIQLPMAGSGPVVIFNKTHKNPGLRRIFMDPRFNHAMSLAIDRDEINERFFLGLGRPQQALPQNTGFVTPADRNFMARHDLAAANALLDEMGLGFGPDGFRSQPHGKPLEIQWEYALQQAWSRELVSLMVSHWARVGVRVNAVEIPLEEARSRLASNDLDIISDWVSPFEPALFSMPSTFMPPYGVARPAMGGAWMDWEKSRGKTGIEPPVWVRELWTLGRDFVSTVPGTDWYHVVGREIIRLNLENLSVIGTLGAVPQPTVISKKLGNVPTWTVNSYYYGYAHPYGPDQWFFK
ncbi:MAG: ABC transporter substrate-binding protein [Desulfobacterales bacterium]|nr:ABC transporter substrate-binding protein [Desulfobacterales bacterium]